MVKANGMIKLSSLLKEEEATSEYPPYMHSAVGFGCHVCKYYYKKEGKHMCNNEHYVELMKTEELIDPTTKKPIDDPSRYCSNWFVPNK